MERLKIDRYRKNRVTIGMTRSWVQPWIGNVHESDGQWKYREDFAGNSERRATNVILVNLPVARDRHVLSARLQGGGDLDRAAGHDALVVSGEPRFDAPRAGDDDVQ